MHEITNYDQSSQSYTINVGDVVGSHTITKGLIYTIKYVAENSVGLSQDSELLYVALAERAQKPNAPTFDIERSTKNQIVVLFAEGVSNDIPVTGYRLYSDKGLPGNSFLIYDGDGVTQTLEYVDRNLLPGQRYLYTLEVLNFNGPSEKSDPILRASCMSPQLFNQLKVSLTSSTKISLTWS